MRAAQTSDRLVKITCPRHGSRWVLATMARAWVCSSVVEWTAYGERVLCGERGERSEETTLAELGPPRARVASPHLDDFCALLVDLHEAGVEVKVCDGHLMLVQRRGESIADDLVLTIHGPSPRIAVGLCGAQNGLTWHVCSECGVPQLTSSRHACKLTPGCPGKLRPLHHVVARCRQKGPRKLSSESSKHPAQYSPEVLDVIATTSAPRGSPVRPLRRDRTSAGLAVRRAQARIQRSGYRGLARA